MISVCLQRDLIHRESVRDNAIATRVAGFYFRVTKQSFCADSRVDSMLILAFVPAARRLPAIGPGTPRSGWARTKCPLRPCSCSPCCTSARLYETFRPSPRAACLTSMCTLDLINQEPEARTAAVKLADALSNIEGLVCGSVDQASSSHC